MRSGGPSTGERYFVVVPRLLVMNQYYWPGIEATAHLLSELSEALTADFDVTVVTGRVRSAPDLPVVARRHRAPLVVISQDVFPEIAVRLKRLQNPLVVAVLRMLVGLYLRRADR